MTPAPPDAPGRTSLADMDAALGRLQEGAAAFARLPVARRIALVQSMRRGYARIARASVEAACLAKGITPGTPAAGEEWLSGPVITLTHLRQWEDALRSIARTGTTGIGPIRETIDGRPCVRGYPRSRLDQAVFPSLAAEVRLRAGERVEERAAFYRDGRADGRVVLVLGAGNVNAIPPLDVATRLFNEGKACILKMHPVNAYLGPLLEDAFADAVRPGYLAVVYGGADEGAYLAGHRAVDEIHITGSDRTHDALVFGPPGPEQERRRAQKRPALDKPITSELGNISPVIVVPGAYTDRQLGWQADHIAGGVVNNASFNCNANKLLVTARSWPQGRDLLARLLAVLRATPPRRAYYPGAADRFESLVAGRAEAVRLGAGPPGTLPWTLLPDLDPQAAEERAFREEPFCAVLSQTAIDATDPAAFLAEAVRFVNERVWGTLSATVVVSPRTLRDPAVARALEQALVDLRYGTVGLNLWAGFGFGIGTPWGGYPGSPQDDIQSGRGFVHNTAMLEGVEKTVLRHPLTAFPKPVTSASHRTLHLIGPRLSALEADGNWLRLPGLIAPALLG